MLGMELTSSACWSIPEMHLLAETIPKGAPAISLSNGSSSLRVYSLTRNPGSRSKTFYKFRNEKTQMFRNIHVSSNSKRFSCRAVSEIGVNQGRVKETRGVRILR
eukprot:TRINITY_DN2242_c0_g1_i3.p1 TRINITY_DN2242_c0_g1~~TRINITY_DN2242_c0_g1_i3.p1  ORF type:complete len:105 (-),score=5.15 TRINITY_DN2242_c0_g1_i3:16-330(-)